MNNDVYTKLNEALRRGGRRFDAEVDGKKVRYHIGEKILIYAIMGRNIGSGYVVSNLHWPRLLMLATYFGYTGGQEPTSGTESFTAEATRQLVNAVTEALEFISDNEEMGEDDSIEGAIVERNKLIRWWSGDGKRILRGFVDVCGQGGIKVKPLTAYPPSFQGTPLPDGKYLMLDSGHQLPFEIEEL